LKKIGILGGTFDPVHFGHLRTAEEVGEIFGLKKVYLIPSNNPPHKKGKYITPFRERLYMLQCAIEGSDILDVLDLEGRRPGYSYTIDTLRELKSERYFGRDVQIYFIIGMDAFLEIDTWKECRELFRYANFVIVKRLGYNNKGIEDLLERLRLNYGKEEKGVYQIRETRKYIYLTDVTPLDISSTKIRRLVREGRSITFLLPEKVKKYILERGLYGHEVN